MSKFFESPLFVWFVLIPGGLTINAITAFADDSVIFHLPLYIGSFHLYLNTHYRWLLQFIFVGAMVAHLSEGYYAYHLATLLNLCTTDVIKWTLQTLLLGFPSLSIIQRKYKEEENKHKQ